MSRTGGAIARAVAAAKIKGGKGKTCDILAPGAGLSRVIVVGLGKPAEFAPAGVRGGWPVYSKRALTLWARQRPGWFRNSPTPS